MRVKVQTGVLWGEFFSGDELRLKSLEKANESFFQVRDRLLASQKNKIDKFTKLFLKGYGNDPELISCIRNLFFNSRELIDSTLLKLNALTKRYEMQTSKDFSKFSERLVNGKYDKLNLKIISFLKTNFTFLFHIRKIRNIIKKNPSDIKLRLVTDHFEAYFSIPISKEDERFIPFLDINNKKEALKKKSYHCTLHLDRYFPEMIEFWIELQRVFKGT